VDTYSRGIVLLQIKIEPFFRPDEPFPPRMQCLSPDDKQL
jgi:hypothetical protein